MTHGYDWFVGVDWGSEEHAICLVDATGQVRGERRVRHERPPLLASVYHLVPRESLDAYQAAVTAAAREAGLRVSSSGPWPPYAFAPDELA